MKTIAFSVSLLFAAMTAYATPPTINSIEALLEALDEKSQMTEIYSAMDIMNRQGATLHYGKGQAQLTMEQQRAVDIVVATAAGVYKRDLTWEGIKPEVIRLMQEALTQEQVDAAIAFYTSPSGRAFLQALPLVKQKTSLVIKSKLEQIQPKAMQEAANALKDAKLVR